MDAGARGRRLLQRREYRAKVSEFIPKELEDQFSYDKNGQLVFELDLKNVGNKLKQGLKKIISGPIIAPTINQKDYQQRVRNKTTNELVPEANSAQMKAMHDAKVKKMEDDKVAAKKKKVDEACWKGYEKKGMKTMFGKRYPNCVKKTKKEEVQYKEEKENRKLTPIKDILDKEKFKIAGKVIKNLDKGIIKTEEISEDMKGMSQKSGDKRSTESGAGMTAQGVAKYNRRTGGNLKTAVTTPPSKLKPGSKAAKRRKSFCARSKSWTGPRGKAARRRWNCSYEPELPMIIDEKKKLYNTSPLSDRVAAWSKKISEASPLTPGRNDYGLPTGLKSSTKTTKKIRVNPNKLPVAEMADFSLDDLEKPAKKYYDLTIPRERAAYSRLKKAGKNPLIKKVDEQKKLNPNAVFPTVSNVKIKNEIISDTGISTRNQKKKFGEAKMTPTQKERKEKYVKGMKKVKGDFTKRYGRDGKSVMYATATKMAMKKEETVSEMDGSKLGIGLATGVVGGGLELMRRAKNAAQKLRQKKQDSLKVEGQMTEQSCGKGEYYCYDEQKCKPIPKGMKVGKGGMLAKEDFYRKKYTVKDGYKKTNKMTKSNKRSGDSKAQYRELHKDLAKYKVKQLKTEGSLHKWFKGSKSKDGKPGWVNVVTGGTCASDKPGEGTPKCVSSSKRASMTKAERLSASRRKKKADPGQQSKSGAAKPTYVATDSKKKK